MFSRISNVVHISTLPRDHLLPFAFAYVAHGGSMFMADKAASRGKQTGVDRFEGLLRKDFAKIESSIAPWGRRENDKSVVARPWLDALRDWADNLVNLNE